MKKALVILVLPLFCLSVFGAPICSINQEMNKDTASQLSQFRKQTTDTCLACEGDACKLKAWPKEQKGDEAVCKLLFCTPSYVSKFFEKPDNVKAGKTRIKFTYSINSKGKIKGINVISAKGAMNKRESYKYLQSFTSKTQFDPLLVNGIISKIEDIQGEHIAFTGKYADMEKTMPAGRGIYRE